MTSRQLRSGDLASVLNRVSVDEISAPTGDSLRRLHRAWLLAIPFESLDIYTGPALRLEVDSLLDKLVGRRRGGICYELNGLFLATLHWTGFDAHLVSARVWMPDGTLTPPFDHAAVIVELDGRWLADVGFGDAFSIPHPLGNEWEEPGRRLRTLPTNGGWRLERDRGTGWEPMYEIDPTPRRLEEFIERCRWHETSPQSPFRRHPLASRATVGGRITIAGRQLIETVHGRRVEHQLESDDQLRHAVMESFGEAMAERFLEAQARHEADDLGVDGG